MSRNESSPWNPKESLDITPKQFELKVVDWLRKSSEGIKDFEVKHLEKIKGNGGEYEFDAVARLTLLGGAEIIIVIECKRYGRPVEREKILALQSKAKDVGAHKAMIFTTTGYQSGALEYATANKIATLVLVDESFHYETKSRGDFKIPKSNRISGIFMSSAKKDSVTSKATNQVVIECLNKWLKE